MMYSIEKLSDKLIREIDILAILQDKEMWHDSPDKLDINWDMYYKMEDIGIFYIFTVRDEDQLIGYCSFILTPHLHYQSRLVAQHDSLFILKEYRSKGIGSKLIDYCDEVLSRDFKANVIQHSVNINHDFSGLLESKDYKLAEKIMIKEIK